MNLQRQTSRRLHEEHLALLGLLGRFAQAISRPGSLPPEPGDSALDLLLGQLDEALRHEVTRHFALEEEQIFPRLRNYGMGDLADLLLDDHAEVREIAGPLLGLLAGARQRSLDAKSWQLLRIQGLELVDRLGSHARKEEDALVPVVDEMLDERNDMEIWNAYAAQ